MIRKLQSLGTFLLVVLIGLSVVAAPPYNPASVISASDDWPKWNSVTPAGVGVLDVSLDATGAVAETSVLRELPSITDQLKSTVKTWKFGPATDGAVSPPSQVLVVFFIAPPAGVTLVPPVSPLLPEDGLAGYVPPGITSFSYPEYPESFFVPGSVVVQGTIGLDGNVGDWKTIRAFEPFTRFALEAAKKWRFRAATLDGQPIVSNVAIDVVFRSALHGK
jgi:hypothetical protein